MTNVRVLLPPLFILLIAACGVPTGTAPPSEPPEPTTSESTAPEAATSTPPVMMWYERYNFDGVVVKVREGEGDGEESDQANNGDRRGEASYVKPSMQAYERRLLVLRQEREKLLRENAMLREQADLQADADFQMRRELAELQSSLARLNAQQHEVTSQTQVIVEEHGLLLGLLDTAVPGMVAQPEGL